MYRKSDIVTQRLLLNLIESSSSIQNSGLRITHDIALKRYRKSDIATYTTSSGGCHTGMHDVGPWTDVMHAMSFVHCTLFNIDDTVPT